MCQNHSCCGSRLLSSHLIDTTFPWKGHKETPTSLFVWLHQSFAGNRSITTHVFVECYTIITVKKQKGNLWNMPINTLTEADMSKYKPKKKDTNMHMCLYSNAYEIRKNPSLSSQRM